MTNQKVLISTNFKKIEWKNFRLSGKWQQTNVCRTDTQSRINVTDVCETSKLSVICYFRPEYMIYYACYMLHDTGYMIYDTWYMNHTWYSASKNGGNFLWEKGMWKYFQVNHLNQLVYVLLSKMFAIILSWSPWNAFTSVHQTLNAKLPSLGNLSR